MLNLRPNEGLKKILPVFSYIFHPMFIPLFGAIYYFLFYDGSYSNLEKYTAFLNIVIFTIVLPIILFFVLKATKNVDSIMIANVAQRRIPIALQCFLTFILIQKNITVEHFYQLHFYYLGGLISCAFAFIFLFLEIKASIHMIGITALTLFVLGLKIQTNSWDLILIVFLLLLNILVAASRLVLKAHTPTDLLIGSVTGILPQLFLFFYKI
jgi:membrane-associated phospholipid phosphatase